MKTFSAAKDITRLAFSPDGQELAASSFKETMVFDVESGKKTKLEGGSTALAWSSGGKLLRAEPVK